MIEEIKVRKEVVVKNEVVKVGEVMKCDICGKVIYDSRDDKMKYGGEMQHWWHVVTGHNDWGNDSIDSIQSKDVCSVKCLQEIFDEYTKESNNENNSCYINIEHQDR